jgi:hypothetical protein
MGWFATLLPSYFVILRESARKACNLSDSGIQLPCDFNRYKDESLGHYIYRQFLIFTGWSIATLLVYWFMILYFVLRPSKIEAFTDEVSTAMLKAAV